MRASCVLPEGPDREALRLRVDGFIWAREATVPAQLAIRDADDDFALAAPLTFAAVNDDPANPDGLMLHAVGLPPLALDAATWRWRCTGTGTEGTGLLELLAWVRGCDLLSAASRLYALRWAARQRVRPQTSDDIALALAAELSAA